jgi:hypothetical protein
LYIACCLLFIAYCLLPIASVFPHHPQHFDVDHQKPDKLPEQVGAQALGEPGGNRRVIALFVGFSKGGHIGFYSLFLFLFLFF